MHHFSRANAKDDGIYAWLGSTGCTLLSHNASRDTLSAKNTAMKMAHTLVSGLFREHVPPLPQGRFIDGGQIGTYLFCSPNKEGDDGKRAEHKPGPPFLAALISSSSVNYALH